MYAEGTSAPELSWEAQVGSKHVGKLLGRVARVADVPLELIHELHRVERDVELAFANAQVSSSAATRSPRRDQTNLDQNPQLLVVALLSLKVAQRQRCVFFLLLLCDRDVALRSSRLVDDDDIFVLLRRVRLFLDSRAPLHLRIRLRLLLSRTTFLNPSALRPPLKPRAVVLPHAREVVAEVRGVLLRQVRVLEVPPDLRDHLLVERVRGQAEVLAEVRGEHLGRHEGFCCGPSWVSP